MSYSEQKIIEILYLNNTKEILNIEIEGIDLEYLAKTYNREGKSYFNILMNKISAFITAQILCSAKSLDFIDEHGYTPFHFLIEQNPNWCKDYCEALPENSTAYSKYTALLDIYYHTYNHYKLDEFVKNAPLDTKSSGGKSIAEILAFIIDCNSFSFENLNILIQRGYDVLKNEKHTLIFCKNIVDPIEIFKYLDKTSNITPKYLEALMENSKYPT